MGAPVTRWTASEQTRLLEIACEQLRADVDVRVTKISRDQGWIELLLDGPTELWLEPTPRWRDTWVLVLDEGELVPDATVAVSRREIRIGLRIRERALHRDGVDIAPLSEVSFHRYTRQSSCVADVPVPAFAPTEPEPAPWWELDCGQTVYVSTVDITLRELPPGTRVRVRAFGFVMPDGSPPPDSVIYEGDAAEPIALAPALPARSIRVELEARAPVSLAVDDIEVLAAPLHAGDLAATMRRAFALWGPRVLADGVTYSEMWTRAMAIADALAARLPARATVGVMLPSGLAWLAVDQAALARGYTVVGLAHDEPADRLAHAIAIARPACIVCEAGNLERVRALGVDAVTPDALTGAPAAPPAVPPAPGDVYAVLFTSGSTGRPKGATRTFAQFHTVIGSYAIGHSPRHLSFQPIAHLSERMYLPAVLIHGGTIAFSRGGAHVLDDLEAFEPTTIGSVPRLFEILYARYRRRAAAIGEPAALAEARRAFGGKLLAVSVGSAPCSAEVLAFMRRCFADIWVSEGYGSTELGTIAVNGRVSEGVDVKLVPVDGGNEIWVRSPHEFAGYLGEDAPRADADGYLATGDLGERDADGRVRVIGRVRNTVKLANGEFVSAERIETALATMPGVERIYVHVVPGAAGVACVVAGDVDTSGSAGPRSDAKHRGGSIDLAALQAHGRAAGLADYELPRAIVACETPTVDNGLLLPSGKLARPAFAAKFGDALSPDAPDATPGESLRDRVSRIAGAIVGRAVDADAPLGAGVGADSLAVAEILATLSDELHVEVPLAWWFEAASLADLARRLAGGGGSDAGEQARADRDLRVPVVPAPRPHPELVLVTGATGFLGAHVVEALAARGALPVAFVRAPDDRAAASRMAAAFARWRIPPVAVHAIAGELADPRAALAGVGAVVHCAAQVSWLASYAALREPNVVGTRAILEAAASEGVPVHFVSTISTADGDEDTTRTFDAMLAGTPYGLSKWIAEHHARAAGATIHRPAMIAGHSERGAGNPDDFVHRYLAGCLELGMAIDHAAAIVDTTPVDFVAAAITALVHAGARGTFHFANARGSLTYRQLAVALGVRAVPYATFRAALPSSARLRPLAGFFAPFAPPDVRHESSRKTDARLDELGIACPRIDAAIAARYVSFARNISK